jgi:hypothetical protein
VAGAELGIEEPFGVGHWLCALEMEIVLRIYSVQSFFLCGYIQALGLCILDF